MATVGQQLTDPESGWRRYDDTDSRIKYIGSGWGVNNPTDGGGVYNSTLHYAPANSINCSYNFKFYGTKFRIVQSVSSEFGTNNKVIIDGNQDIFSCRLQSTITRQVLVYEKTGLQLGIHEVAVNSSTDGTYTMELDAIDIDDTGYLVHPILNQVNDINSMKVGECIPCRYTATTSGSAGYFSELGTCIVNEIPIAGSATPDGLFYFIKADKGMLVADRVVQTSISWDTLNTAKYIEGDPTGFKLPLDLNTYSGNATVISGTLGKGICKTTHSATSQYYNFYRTISSANGTLAIKIEDLTTTGDKNNMNLELYLWYGKTFIRIDVRDGGADFIIVPYNSTTISYTVPKSKGLFITASFNGTFTINGELHSSLILSIAATSPSIVVQHASRNGAGTITSNISYVASSTTSIDISKLLPTTYKLRSLSGGVAYADASSNKSLTDHVLGAWPTNNEWDKYIKKNDLQNKITSGDENIWHYKSIFSWVKETPIKGVWVNSSGATSDITAISSQCRVVRGCDSRTESAWKDICQNGSGATYTIEGFRPVLNYIESDIASEVIY